VLSRAHCCPLLHLSASLSLARVCLCVQVKKEFDLLDDEARVFKLNGPVLVKQDVSEAKVTVMNRLKFFQAEM